MSFQYLILAAVAGLRLWELYHSWRHLGGRKPSPKTRALAEPIFPWMAALHVAWLVACFAEVAWREPLFHPWLVLPMLLLWGGALGLRFWVIQSLGEDWNVRVVQRRPQTVVTTGPYAFVRHPNYLAVVVEIAAVPLMVGAYWTALLGTLANAAVLAQRIRGEEAHLFKYAAYKRAFTDKKRLLPGVF